MSEFIQLHILTSYPPSNLNRDDLGRPKTAFMGGYERLRVSSQSLKRHWRTSDIFQATLADNMGIRTKKYGQKVLDTLLAEGVQEKTAQEWAALIADQFGSLEKDSVEIKQLAHISPDEDKAVMQLVSTLVQENRAPTADELKQLKRCETAVDIALFGRMLASSPEHNIEAACQVAHALSVHSIVVEDDYFTAIDDLNAGQAHAGSAHIGESGFAAALFYQYICINKTDLVKNLLGDEALANQAIRSLTEAAVKVAPSGKQNSFGSRAYASFVLAEQGSQQPRSLSVAYLKPVRGDDMGEAAINALQHQLGNLDKVYGACADNRYQFNALTGEGQLSTLLDFLTKQEAA